MARLISHLKHFAREITGGYEPAKHYMRGPGPKTAEAQRKRSTLSQPKGGSFPRTVDSSGTAKVAPKH